MPDGTQTMTWDTEGRIATSVDGSGASSYVSDADGNRNRDSHRDRDRNGDRVGNRDRIADRDARICANRAAPARLDIDPVAER